MREFVRAVLILAISVLPLQARAEKAVSLSATEKVRLWEGTSVHSKDVTLETFLPEQGKSGVGVIICPGGSYCWHDYETEGRRVAKWLNDNGIAAFLLKYRVLGTEAWSTSAALTAGQDNLLPASFSRAISIPI